MKVVILCGGRGTRLKEETEYRPKPMVPIGDRPILWHIMKLYAEQGHKEFILCLGYKGQIIKDYFLNYRQMTNDVTVKLGIDSSALIHDEAEGDDWTVTMVDTGESTLTAGRIKRVEQFLDDDDFFLTYGDGVGDVDVNAALQFHEEHGKLLTLTAVHPPGRFGELGIGDNCEVLEFNEKPQTEAGWINGGFFVASKGIFSYLDNCDQVMFEQGPIESLCAERQLVAFQHDGFWQPMDTYSESKLLNGLWNRGDAPWKIW